MKVADYERQAATTATYRPGSIYPYLGLIEEIGEVAGVLAKAERDNGGHLDEARREQLLSELSDVLWMLAAVARADGHSLLHAGDTPRFAEVATPEEAKSGYAAYLCRLSHFAAVRLQDFTLGIKADSSALNLWESLCFTLGFRPADVAAYNLQKLASRQQRGVIHGAGDDR